MRKVLICGLHFFLFGNYLNAQCPQVFEAKIQTADCIDATPVCQVCEDDEFILNAEGVNLPDGGCINWYYNSSGQFTNPNEGTFLGCSPISADAPCSVCLEMTYLMVNPTGDDIANEFFVFNSGGGVNADAILVDFGNESHNGSPENEDIGSLACQLQKPNFQLIGCENAIPIGVGDFIPQNALVIVFTNASVISNYDFSSFCNVGAPVFYTQNSCTRTIEAFPNQIIGGSITQGIANIDCGCSAFFSYSRNLQQEGDFIFASGNIGNEIVQAPTPNFVSGEIIKNEIESISLLVNEQMCGIGSIFIRGVIAPFFQGCDKLETDVMELSVNCPKAEILAPDSICLDEVFLVQGSGGEVLDWNIGIDSTSFSYLFQEEITFELVVQVGNCLDRTKHTVFQLPEEHENCGCTTFAGSQPIPNNPLEFCQFEMATLTTNQDIVLDRNDVISYVLHSSETFSPNEIIFENNLPEFKFDPVLMVTEATYYITAIAGNESNTGLVDLSDPCLSFGPAIPIIFKAPPVAFLLGDNSVCEGEELFLQVAFNGTPPYQFTISENGNTLIEETTNFGIFDLSVSPIENKIYKIEEFQDVNCQGILLVPTIEVEVIPNIEISLIEAILFPNGTYELKLEISGGQPPFAFSGSSIRFEDGFYVTDPILCGEETQICVMDNTCNETCFADLVDCQSNCSNFAGNMLDDTVNLCQNERSEFAHFGEILNQEQILEFVLHSNSNSKIGTVFKKTRIPELEFSNDLRTDVVYFFSAVVGQDDGTGQIDFSDPCLSVAPGTPIIFHNFPGVVLPTKLNVCRDLETNILLDFTGNSPFSYNYFIDNFEFTNGRSTRLTDTLALAFNENRMVSIESISDKYCTTSIEKTVEVEVFENLGFENLKFDCSANQQSYKVSFFISGANTSDVTVVGEGEFSLDLFQSEFISNGADFHFEVFDKNHCDTLILNGNFNCNCEAFAGNLQPLSLNNAPKIICGTESIKVESQNDAKLPQNGKMEFILHDNSGLAIGNILDRNETGFFTFKNNFLKNKIYYISSIVGEINSNNQVDLNDPCLSISLGRPIIFQSLPNASFTIGNEICSGDSAILGFTFDGVPPFLLKYEIEQNGIVSVESLTATTNSHFEFFHPEIGEGTASIRLISVESFGCKVQLSGTQSVEVKPAIQSFITEEICGEDSLLINGIVFNQNHLLDTFEFQTDLGCDSLVLIEISHQKIDTNFISEKICENDSLIINHTIYDFENSNGVEVFDTEFCDSVVSINLDFHPLTFESILDTFCVGTTFELEDFVFDASNPTGDLFFIDENGCDSIVSVQLFFQNPEALNLEIDKNLSFRPGESVELSPLYNGEISELEWSPSELVSCADCLVTEASPISNTTFKISIWDKSGCFFEEQVNITLLNDLGVFIPQAFSPNNDGINDFFVVYGSSQIETVEFMQIFDRWGNQIFSKENLSPNENSDGWDGFYKGEQLDAGVYIYQIKVRFKNGKTEIFKGDLSIL